jgi:Glycosyltransferase family 87
VLSLVASGITWLYVHRILVPWTHYLDVAKGQVIDPMGDMYSPWVGTRALLFQRRNPYGPEVSQEIQLAFYGHAIHQTFPLRGAALINEQRFVYPVYTVLILAPAAYADFADVRRWSRFVLGLLVAFTVWLSLDLLHWRLPWEAATALTLFTLATPQIVQGLRLEQLGLLVGSLLVAGAWCVSRRNFKTAGVLLALATIKPQMALLPLCWFAIWSIGDWPKRWRLAAGFMATMTALLAAGESLLPGWFGSFLAGVTAYRKYSPTWSIPRLALGDAFGEILSGVLILATLWFGWQNRKTPGDSRQFCITLAAFLMGALLAFPLFVPFNQVLLILPAMLLMQDWKTLPRVSRLIFTVIVGWSWIVSSALLLHPPRIDSQDQMPLLPSFLSLFFPVFLPLLLITRRNSVTQLEPAELRPARVSVGCHPGSDH